MRLYHIAADIRSVIDAAPDGELSGDDMNRLDELVANLDDKVNAICSIIRESECSRIARQAEIDRLQTANRTDANLIERLKLYMLTALTFADAREHRTELFKIYRQSNPPSMVPVVDPEFLPEEFKRVKIEADRTAALNSWKNTGKIPEGFRKEQGEHLRIK